jgi:FkbM family methyltransferase
VVSSDPVDAKLAAIHQALVLKHGDLSKELPEQKMAARYLTGSEKVLEIGANVGRNTLVIAHILAQSTGSIVTLESDPAEAAKLEENLAANPGLNVLVEKSALSLRKLIQREWDTKPFDYDVEPMPDDYQKVDTITLEELRNKYGAAAEFDTLVLDCEGAFYYILQDTPEVLDGINLVIMENDYHDFSHKQFVDEQLTQRGFVVDYSEPGGWGPCVDNFFEVWSKKSNVV